MIPVAISLFEQVGGVVAGRVDGEYKIGTLESRGPIGLDRPSRQWDYPFGK